MSFVSQNNQDLLWDLIAETNLLHTVADRIPVIQQKFQFLIMKYQFDDVYTTITDKNKVLLKDMIEYIKSCQDKIDTAETLRKQREDTLQQSMSAIEEDFKQYSTRQKPAEINFADPEPDPKSYTPIQQVLQSQQNERENEHKLDILIQEMREIKKLMSKVLEQNE